MIIVAWIRIPICSYTVYECIGFPCWPIILVEFNEILFPGGIPYSCCLRPFPSTHIFSKQIPINITHCRKLSMPTFPKWWVKHIIAISDCLNHSWPYYSCSPIYNRVDSSSFKEIICCTVYSGRRNNLYILSSPCHELQNTFQCWIPVDSLNVFSLIIVIVGNNFHNGFFIIGKANKGPQLLQMLSTIEISLFFKFLVTKMVEFDPHFDRLSQARKLSMDFEV